MKQCKNCLNDFVPSNNRQIYCAKCGIEKRRERQRARIMRFRNDIKEKLSGTKALCGCFICGENDPAKLHFHHIDPETKYKNVSSLTDDKSIKKEISKCIILCSKCHVLYHKRMKNSIIQTKDDLDSLMQSIISAYYKIINIFSLPNTMTVNQFIKLCKAFLLRNDKKILQIETEYRQTIIDTECFRLFKLHFLSNILKNNNAPF